MGCEFKHENENTWAEYDARGIYLARVCDACVNERLATYRPEVLTNPGYEASEPIEPDDGDGFFS